MTAIPNALLNYSALPDVELARRCASGDFRAMRHLVQTNNQRLFRAAWSILKNREEAEDAMHSCYVKALAAMGSFEGRSSITTWLTRIAINEALARRRVLERRRRNLQEEGVDVLETYREQMANGSRAPNPEAEAAREQLRAILERAVAALPDNFRTVFVLHEVEGMSVEETARALDLPIGTVKTRLMRARLKLQQSLEPDVRTALTGTFPFAGADCDRLTERVLTDLMRQDRPTGEP